jgi:F-type H+-transporting ATPase subunit gamma
MLSKHVMNMASHNSQAVLCVASRRNFAVNEKQIKLRMKSVISIEKITKAMKMVAASKMRGELARLEAGRKFGFNSIDMMFKSDAYLQRKAPSTDAGQDASEFIVPLSSDKGLCGGINSNVVREIKGYIKHKNRSKMRILPIGEKGSIGMIRPFPDLIKMSISEITVPNNYPTIMSFAEVVTKESEGFDKIVIYYNEFKSAVS